jgi:hypothetical protein
MRFLAILLLSVLLVLLISVPAAHPSESPDPGQRYVLVKGADYQEGCFDPCLCPILIAAQLDGQFVLQPVDVDGLWAAYDISSIRWTVRFNGIFHEATGSGTLRVNTTERKQLLVLDLRIDGEDPVPFDSGIVPLTTPWPGIDVTVSRNGFVCYDQVFHLVSEPSGPVIASESTWSTLKSRFDP